jgi:hypothetical protein
VSWGPDIGTPFLQEKEVDKVAVGSIADSKPNFVVSVQAAASLSVGAGELVIAVGTNVRDTNQTRVISALQLLQDHLKEGNYPQGPLQFTGAFSTPPDHGTVALNAAAIPGTFDEDNVVIAYDLAFYDAGNSSNIGNQITRAIEVYLEQISKFN